MSGFCARYKDTKDKHIKNTFASATAVTGFVTVLHNDPAAHKDYCLEDTGFELEHGTTARTRDYVMLGQCAVPSYRKRGCVIIHLFFLYYSKYI